MGLKAHKQKGQIYQTILSNDPEVYDYSFTVFAEKEQESQKCMSVDVWL